MQWRACYQNLVAACQTHAKSSERGSNASPCTCTRAPTTACIKLQERVQLQLTMRASAVRHFAAQPCDAGPLSPRSTYQATTRWLPRTASTVVVSGKSDCIISRDCIQSRGGEGRSRKLCSWSLTSCCLVTPPAALLRILAADVCRGFEKMQLINQGGRGQDATRLSVKQVHIHYLHARAPWGGRCRVHESVRADACVVTYTRVLKPNKRSSATVLHSKKAIIDCNQPKVLLWSIYTLSGQT